MPADRTLNSTNASHQRQTILNLYNSGIEKDIISYQLDIPQEEIEKIIEEEEKKKTQILSSENSIGTSFYLDAIVNIDLAIKRAQTRMWEALQSEPHFDISMKETYRILNEFSRSKATFVILHVDLVGSTQLSMTLPLDRLTTIIQTFSQEMSFMIEMYGGYVLKYIGDAVLAFFVTNPSKNRDNEDDNIQQKKDQYYLPCINAINCARSMIKVVKDGINPILNQSDYPDIAVRIGIDVGEIAIIQYGWDIHTCDETVVKEPHYDILGHTINVAVKMTGLTKPNSFIIGESVYDIFDEKQKSTFETLNVSPSLWSYLNEKTGSTYGVYSSTS
jgi:adenylate cyclase